MPIEEKDVEQLVTLQNLWLAGLLQNNQDIVVGSTTDEANMTNQSNVDTKVVTDQFSPKPSPQPRWPGDHIIREPPLENSHQLAFPTRPGKGKSIELLREDSSSSENKDDIFDEFLNSGFHLIVTIVTF